MTDLDPARLAAIQARRTDQKRIPERWHTVAEADCDYLLAVIAHLQGENRRVQAENDSARALLVSSTNKSAESIMRLEADLSRLQVENERLVAQARDISSLLQDADVGACPLPTGVRSLIHRAEQAEGAREIARSQRDIAEADLSRLQAERDEAVKAWDEEQTARLNGEADRDSWRRVAERLESEKLAAEAARDEAQRAGAEKD